MALSQFKKELSDQQLSDLFADLCNRGIVKVDGTKVSYDLPVEILKKH